MRCVTSVLTQASDFDQLSLSNLPTQKADDTPDKAKEHFAHFLRLARYTKLKRELAGGTDDLITVFEHARRSYPSGTDADVARAEVLEDLCQRLATLTRRDVQTVQEAVKALDFVATSAVAADIQVIAPDFTNEQGLERLWQVLQMVETFGVSVADVVKWTTIVTPSLAASDRFALARDLKHTLAARFESEAWQRVAQSVFDKLRGQQRDALALHVMHQHGFARLEQLFEYFLIDPGTESVVQTSRLRLAISSVQLFIQRCLLNLEKHVHPSAIVSQHWQWMKRYRLWEANRKIFLFPENWLEPEFRDDKTELFQELEGSLLQGDVSSNLTEDAFFTYLKRLEELARLDIVGMYCEEKPLEPAANTLHVIGRTYSTPHKYFYRHYAHQQWTPWESVGAEIEGNHLVPVMWRERLHLFWLTFLDDTTPEPPNDSVWEGAISVGIKDGIEAVMFSQTNEGVSTSVSSSNRSSAKNKPAAEMTFNELHAAVSAPLKNKRVRVQLHWSEYLRGEWSSRASGTLGTISATVPFNFDSSSVFVHVSKLFEDGEERAVKIHLNGAINQAFRVVSKNSLPEWDTRESPPAMPYSNRGVRANRHAGAGSLEVTFVEQIKTEDGKAPVLTSATKGVLAQGSAYTLLRSSNALSLNSAEIASLISPFFYQDNQHTFYVEPTFSEKTIEAWEEWVIPLPTPQPEPPDWWEVIPLKPNVPEYKIPIPVDPRDPIWNPPIDEQTPFETDLGRDWLTNPGTVLQFDDELIGPGGKTDFNVLNGGILNGGILSSDILNSDVAGGLGGLNTGGHFDLGVAPGSALLDNAGLVATGGGLNVIGSSGLVTTHLGHLTSLTTRDLMNLRTTRLRNR